MLTSLAIVCSLRQIKEKGIKMRNLKFDERGILIDVDADTELVCPLTLPNVDNLGFCFSCCAWLVKTEASNNRFEIRCSSLLLGFERRC